MPRAVHEGSTPSCEPTAASKRNFAFNSAASSRAASYRKASDTTTNARRVSPPSSHGRTWRRKNSCCGGTASIPHAASSPPPTNRSQAAARVGTNQVAYAASTSSRRALRPSLPTLRATPHASQKWRYNWSKR